MSWIKTISYEEATGSLKKLYERIKGPEDKVDNVLRIHSLRPHTLESHMSLYKSVLHHKDNALPKWYLETLGIWVSQLNQCNYCVSHHSEGLKRLLKDDEKYNEIIQYVHHHKVTETLDGKWMAGIEYAKQLTQDLTNVKQEAIEKLDKAGFTDGEVLEINQLVSYFNYVNRTVIGLGVNTKGDIIGLSPNDNEDPNNWSHA